MVIFRMWLVSYSKAGRELMFLLFPVPIIL